MVLEGTLCCGQECLQSSQQGAELLGHEVWACSFLPDTANLSPVTTQVDTRMSTVEELPVSHIQANIRYCRVSSFCQSDGHKMFFRGLNLHFPHYSLNLESEHDKLLVSSWEMRS